MSFDQEIRSTLGENPSRSEQSLDLLALDIYLHKVRHEPVGGERCVVECYPAIVRISRRGDKCMPHPDRTTKPGVYSHASADASAAIRVALERKHPGSRELRQDQGVIPELATNIKGVRTGWAQATKVTIQLDLVKAEERAGLKPKVYLDTQPSTNPDRKPTE